MKLNGKQITTISIIAILGFCFMMSSVAFANGRFEFSIDEGTEKAINDLSRFSDDPFNMVVNNYHSQMSSCVYGCEYAFDSMASGPNVIGMSGFMKSECVNVCKNEEEYVPKNYNDYDKEGNIIVK